MTLSAEAELEYVGAAATRQPEELRFRILQRGEWRRAFRLEEVFWTLLEDAARAGGVKLTDYVREVLAEQSAHANDASRLRAHAAEWLRTRLAERETQLQQTSPATMLRAVPMPGFIIAEGRGLVAYNNEFQAFVRRMAERQQILHPSQARMSLDAPTDRIVSTLEESRRPAVECGFRLSLNDRNVTGRVRVSLVPGGSDGPELMGFITAVERQRMA